ncbi:purine permease 3-like isoform X1 [Salvia divinorum]|uniref:Purine permease 3-like isoform X1 n=1 Tax=Salvia divinorum TaxID=28513 RepID=A0ABD1G2N9_SALDI
MRSRKCRSWLILFMYWINVGLVFLLLGNPKRSKRIRTGETRYYFIVFCSFIVLQCFFLGTIGVIYYSSSLFSGIAITVLLPITELLVVVFYHEKFQAEKGVSLFLSIWDFISYFYGDIKHNKDTVTNKDDVENGLIAETQLADKTSIS